MYNFEYIRLTLEKKVYMTLEIGFLVNVFIIGIWSIFTLE